ncbi:MAG: peptidylprolyl isomerase [Synergistaceae bacterium]|nr:peptidylprolyl isomerase [Synergistaceae bacterium]
MKKKIVVSIAAFLFALAAFAALAATPEPASPAPEPAGPAKPEKDPERLLAKVGGEEIREKDIDQVLKMMGPQSAVYDNEQGRKAILDEMVGVHLFALSGKEKGLDKTPDYELAVRSFSLQTLARLTIENTLKDITSKEEEAKKFYDENTNQFKKPDEIRARHILLNDDVTSADMIKLVQDELKKGVSFDLVAAVHSKDPTAAQAGGDLGFFSRGQMVPEFEEAAFALQEPGDVSAPVLSQFGWHIIKLEGKSPSSVTPYDEVKAQIIQYLTNEKEAEAYQGALESLKKTYTVEYSEPAPVK